MFKFDNSYIHLGDKFFQRALPQKVSKPALLLWNSELANNLHISSSLQDNHNLLAQYFSGSKVLTGSQSIALAYSGHQFGHFNPQLGDGRAHLLGEVLDVNNVRRDIQLKGSGQTAFSRRGDGKCALAPALREYIMSEALYALGTPTARCLAVVSTGEVINRGTAKAGAVVSRVAASHIRVGTFQYFAVRRDLTSLASLLDYSIDRHFPEIENANECQEQRILLFLEKTLDKQISLIIEWLRIGFIHGVMNTDNTAICGETIDFGPCAMMGSYDEKAVFSSIDEYGRYAFGNQGKIAQWNMARLADSLLPLLINHSIESDENQSDEEALQQQALTKLEFVIHQFNDKFNQAYYAMYAGKLGVVDVNNTNIALIDVLLEIMQKQGLDYTQTFYRLTQSLFNPMIADELRKELGQWYEGWLKALKQEHNATKKVYAEVASTIMNKSNPIVIPRNHHVENILTQCENVIADDSLQQSASERVGVIVETFLKVLRSPYREIDTTKEYQDVAEDGDKYYQTFCGT